MRCSGVFQGPRGLPGERGRTGPAGAAVSNDKAQAALWPALWFTRHFHIGLSLTLHNPTRRREHCRPAGTDPECAWPQLPGRVCTDGGRGWAVEGPVGEGGRSLTSVGYSPPVTATTHPQSVQFEVMDRLQLAPVPRFCSSCLLRWCAKERSPSPVGSWGLHT